MSYYHTLQTGASLTTHYNLQACFTACQGNEATHDHNQLNPIYIVVEFVHLLQLLKSQNISSYNTQKSKYLIYL